MALIKKNKMIILNIFLISSLMFLFQNCGSGLDAYNIDQDSVDTTGLSCIFNGENVPNGGSVNAYLHSSHTSCASVMENRGCTNGVLSGNYSYASCAANALKSCLFNTLTIPHGQTVNAFRSSSVSFGSACESETRICNDGVLSTSNPNSPFSFGSCSVGGPASCLFSAENINVPHNGVVSAFQEVSVPFGQTCQNQGRVCVNGVLSGTYNNPSCSVQTPNSCVFNGTIVNHGITVKSYLTGSSTNCDSPSWSVNRTCNNGVLSNGYDFAVCVNPVTSQLPCNFNGRTLASTESVFGYFSTSAPVSDPNACLPEIRTCNNGQLSGTAPHSECVKTYPSARYGSHTIADGEMVLLIGVLYSLRFSPEVHTSVRNYEPKMFNPNVGGCMFFGVRNLQGQLYKGYLYISALESEKCKNPMMGTPVRNLRVVGTQAVAPIPSGSAAHPNDPTTPYLFVRP